VSKKKVDKQIEDALDLEKTEEPQDLVHNGDSAGGVPILPSKEEMQLARDYNQVRKNLKEIINIGNTAIDGILVVADETEAPRAYEVAAQMIKTVSEVNKDLLEMHNKMKQIKKEEGGQKATNITNNSLFVGSTKELQKLLKRQKQDLIEMELEEKEKFEYEIIDAEVEEIDVEEN
jgi:hypothetical protein